MNPDPKLHHYCQIIKEGYLEDVVEMYKLLGFKVTYIPPEKDWIMVGQDSLNFAIQITQVNDSPIKDIESKNRTHIAFISEDPQGVVNKIKDWANNKGFNFREGKWSDIEMFFDLSDIFINFVVEVMHTSIDE